MSVSDKVVLSCFFLAKYFSFLYFMVDLVILNNFLTDNDRSDYWFSVVEDLKLHPKDISSLNLMKELFLFSNSAYLYATVSLLQSLLNASLYYCTRHTHVVMHNRLLRAPNMRVLHKNKDKTTNSWFLCAQMWSLLVNQGDSMNCFQSVNSGTHCRFPPGNWRCLLVYRQCCNCFCLCRSTFSWAAVVHGHCVPL